MTTTAVHGRSRRSQTSRNLIANVGVFCLQTLVAFLFTPYLITRLGVGVFGLIPLANTLASYVSVFTVAVQSSVGRYLAIATNQGDEHAAGEVFNTAFWVVLAGALVLFPLMALFAMFAPSIFDVPAGAETAARWFFGISFLAYLIAVVRSIFMTAGVAANRLDLQNLSPLAEILVRPVLTVIVFSTGLVSVVVVAIGWLAGVLLALVIAVVVWRHLAPGMSLSLSQFSRSRLSSVSSTAGWMMVSQLGTLLYLGVDMVIANLRLGAEIAGMYGAVLVWSVFLRGVATAASGVVTPVALAAHARGDREDLAETMKGAVRLMGLCIGLPVVIAAGFSREILGAWLGAEFVMMAPVMIMLVAPLVLNLAVLPLFALQLTLDRVRVPGIVTLVGGVINVAVAWWLAGVFPNGFGIALGGALVLTAKNAIFTPLYAAHIQGVRRSIYLVEILPGLLMASVSTGFIWAMVSAGVMSGLAQLSGLAVFVAVSYAAVAWRLLGRRERDFIAQIAREFVPKAAR